MRACGSVRLGLRDSRESSNICRRRSIRWQPPGPWETARSPPLQQRIRAGEQVDKRSQRPRRHHFDAFRGVINKILDPDGVDHRRSLGRPRRFAQEGRLLGVAFDEVNLGPCPYRRARKRSPGRESHRPEPRSTQRRASGANARSCSESATWRVHNSGIGRGRDQIDAPLPLKEQRDEAVEPRRCFT